MASLVSSWVNAVWLLIILYHPISIFIHTALKRSWLLKCWAACFTSLSLRKLRRAIKNKKRFNVPLHDGLLYWWLQSPNIVRSYVFFFLREDYLIHILAQCNTLSVYVMRGRDLNQAARPLRPFRRCGTSSRCMLNSHQGQEGHMKTEGIGGKGATCPIYLSVVHIVLGVCGWDLASDHW